MAGEPCKRCGHSEASHDAELELCLALGCLCLRYLSEADEAEDAIGSGEQPDEPDELNFDRDKR